MTKWIANNYIFFIKLYIWLSLARSHFPSKILQIDDHKRDANNKRLKSSIKRTVKYMHKLTLSETASYKNVR